MKRMVGSTMKPQKKTAEIPSIGQTLPVPPFLSVWTAAAIEHGIGRSPKVSQITRAFFQTGGNGAFSSPTT